MKPTLLIAEGDAELCEVYQKFLMERGYKVETAVDGLDCLAKLQRTMPAVLVLDRELQWGGGDGVLAWLREYRTACGVAVVLMATAGYYSAVAAPDTEPPVVAFLPKPFTLTALLETVRAAIAQKEREGLGYLNPAAACSEFFIG